MSALRRILRCSWAVFRTEELRVSLEGATLARAYVAVVNAMRAAGPSERAFGWVVLSQLTEAVAGRRCSSAPVLLAFERLFLERSTTALPAKAC